MTAKEYLTQLRHIQNRIEAKRERIEHLTARTEKVTQAISGTPHSGSKLKDDAYAALIDAKDELVRDITKLIKTESEVYHVIQAVPDPDVQLLLELRYINGCSWEEIAAELGYDVRNVYRLHGKGLSIVGKEINKTCQ